MTTAYAHLRSKVIRLLSDFDKKPFSTVEFTRAYVKKYDEPFDYGGQTADTYLMCLPNVGFNYTTRKFRWLREEEMEEEKSSSEDDDRLDDEQQEAEEIDEDEWFEKEEFEKFLSAVYKELRANPDPTVSAADAVSYVKQHLVRMRVRSTVQKVLFVVNGKPLFNIFDFYNSWRLVKNVDRMPLGQFGYSKLRQLLATFEEYPRISSNHYGVHNQRAEEWTGKKIIEFGKKATAPVVAEVSDDEGKRRKVTSPVKEAAAGKPRVQKASTKHSPPGLLPRAEKKENEKNEKEKDDATNESKEDDRESEREKIKQSALRIIRSIRTPCYFFTRGTFCNAWKSIHGGVIPLKQLRIRTVFDFFDSFLDLKMSTTGNHYFFSGTGTSSEDSEDELYEARKSKRKKKAVKMGLDRKPRRMPIGRKSHTLHRKPPVVETIVSSDDGEVSDDNGPLSTIEKVATQTAPDDKLEKSLDGVQGESSGNETTSALTDMRAAKIVKDRGVHHSGKEETATALNSAKIKPSDGETKKVAAAEKAPKRPEKQLKTNQDAIDEQRRAILEKKAVGIWRGRRESISSVSSTPAPVPQMCQLDETIVLSSDEESCPGQKAQGAPDAAPEGGDLLTSDAWLSPASPTTSSSAAPKTYNSSAGELETCVAVEEIRRPATRTATLATAGENESPMTQDLSEKTLEEQNGSLEVITLDDDVSQEGLDEESNKKTDFMDFDWNALPKGQCFVTPIEHDEAGKPYFFLAIAKKKENEAEDCERVGRQARITEFFKASGPEKVQSSQNAERGQEEAVLASVSEEHEDCAQQRSKKVQLTARHINSDTVSVDRNELQERSQGREVEGISPYDSDARNDEGRSPSNDPWDDREEHMGMEQRRLVNYSISSEDFADDERHEVNAEEVVERTLDETNMSEPDGEELCSGDVEVRDDEDNVLKKKRNGTIYDKEKLPEEREEKDGPDANFHDQKADELLKKKKACKVLVVQGEQRLDKGPIVSYTTASSRRHRAVLKTKATVVKRTAVCIQRVCRSHWCFLSSDDEAEKGDRQQKENMKRPGTPETSPNKAASPPKRVRLSKEAELEPPQAPATERNTPSRSSSARQCGSDTVVGSGEGVGEKEEDLRFVPSLESSGAEKKRMDTDERRDEVIPAERTPIDLAKGKRQEKAKEVEAKERPTATTNLNPQNPGVGQSKDDLYRKALHVILQFSEPFSSKEFKKAFKQEFEEKFSNGEQRTRAFLMTIINMCYDEENDKFSYDK